MPTGETSRIVRVSGGVGLLAIVGVLGWLLSRSAHTPSFSGLIFVVGGEVALLLLGFSVQEIAAAVAHAGGRPAPTTELQRSAYLWEAAARNAWVLSVLAAAVELVSQLCSSFTGPATFVAGLGERALSVTGGFGLAAVLAIPAVRLSGQADAEPPDAEDLPETLGDVSPSRGPGWERWPGYGLLGLLVVWPLLSPGSGPGFQPWEWLLHWPAWLVVAGCALALVLYLGRTGRDGSITVGLACAGVIGGLFGLTQALQGFANFSIPDVAGGMTFAVSACYAALLGLAAFAMPGQDRALRLGRGARSLATSRLAWYGFPFFALLLFAIVLKLVLIPIEKRETPAPEDEETTSLVEPSRPTEWRPGRPSGEDDPLELGPVAQDEAVLLGEHHAFLAPAAHDADAGLDRGASQGRQILTAQLHRDEAA